MVCHLSSHLFAGVLAGEGPSQDSPQFTPVMQQAAQQTGWHRVVADAAYDGEHNHRLCREQLGIKHTLIPLNRRNSGRRWPKTRYRRQMKRRFSQTRYHQRWQIESAISRHRRRLGSAVKARALDAQQREGYLRVLTHNLMILRFGA